MAALSPEIIAELKLEEAINSATVGEINGCPYLLLMTVDSTSGIETAATLRVLDVSDTSNPVEVVSIKAPIQILPPSGDVILAGDYIYSYLWNGPESILWILDVSNIPSITEVSCKEIQFPLLWPDISGDYMIARTAFPPYFAVYDISNPDNPGKITDFEVNRGDRSPQSGTQTVATAFSDSRFFVLEESGLTPFDMLSPSEPQQCSFYKNKEWGLSPLETTEGTGETITKGVFSGNSFLDIGISGDHAFISAGDSGLVVLDVSDIEDIHEVARLELPYYTKKSRF
ncbi:MAG: hypothetical protein JW762_02410 [Dehalococcoidales bacterium]|nr:hypothetical protein [Dehalococcoidales bacterium]